MANDFFGNEIKSGDVVACLQKGSSTSYHIYGIVLTGALIFVFLWTVTKFIFQT